MLMLAHSVSHLLFLHMILISHKRKSHKKYVGDFFLACTFDNLVTIKCVKDSVTSFQ